MPETEEVVSNEAILDEPLRKVEAPEADKPETDPDSETEVEQEKKGKGGFTKKIDKLTARNYQLQETNAQLQERLDRIERRLAGENAPAKPTVSGAPKLDDFKNDPDPWDSYYKALARYEAKSLLDEDKKSTAQQNEQQQTQKIFDSYNKKVTEARAKYEDFDEIVGQSDIPIPQAVQLAIVEMENGPDVAYYLGQNPEEAAKLVSMTPLAAVRAIGRIETSLASNDSSETKPVSRAAAPIRPVGASSTRSTRSLEEMSQKEYNRIRDEQERKRREG